MILAEELPSYFQAVQQERILAISDVSTDPATKELKQTQSYSDGEVKSLIDASIILGKGIGGVVCCESTRTERLVICRSGTCRFDSGHAFLHI